MYIVLYVGRSVMMDLFAWLMLPLLKRRFNRLENELLVRRAAAEGALRQEGARRAHVPQPDEVMARKYARHDYETAVAREALLTDWRHSLAWCEATYGAWQYIQSLDTQYLEAMCNTIELRVKAEQAGVTFASVDDGRPETAA